MSGTVYPGAIDNIQQPGPNDVTNILSHAGTHDSEILAIQAVETKLGTGASTATNNTFLAGTGTGTSAFIGATAAQIALGLGTLATLNSVSLTANVTGTLPVANGGTGITSLGSGIATFLGTPTSANLATAVTNETGTGALVFGTSPAITTPTGIVKGDVGLGNVDNTSDVTKNSAVAALTNKDLTSTTNTFPNGTLVQSVSAEFSGVATGATIMPNDDTIPQNTEGDQYMTLAITPKSTTNTLVIQVVFMFANSTVQIISGALYQDATANAIAAIGSTAYVVGAPNILPLTKKMAAGTISSTTFKFRAGTQSTGTLTMNGVSGARYYGGSAVSSITIWEYKS